MNAWIPGFIAGVAATLVGFICTAIWDVYKWRRENNKRMEAMLSMAIDELKNNIRLARRNSEILTQEISLLSEKKINLNPLSRLRAGAWDLLRFNFPDFLIEHELLQAVNTSAHIIEEINEIIRSREVYRQNNEAMSNFPEKLAKYDQLINEQIEKLLKNLTEIESKTKKFYE